MIYEIVLRGERGPAVQSEFEDLEVVVGEGRTVLRGDLPDQAAVYGVLARIEDFGLELVALRRLDTSRGISGPERNELRVVASEQAEVDCSLDCLGA